MPKGGARVGSGRKPKDDAARWLGGDAGGRGAKSKPAKVVPLPLVAAPSWLSAEQRSIWDDLAPKACAVRTLTVETVPGFALLCKQIVMERQMAAEIEADGLSQTKVSLQMDESGGGLQSVEKKAHHLLAQHRGMMQRVEAGFLRYRLCAMGKALTAAEPVKDEWAEFEGESGGTH